MAADPLDARPVRTWSQDAMPDEGSRAAQFEALYREHHQRLRRFCLGMTGQEAVAEDIAQETLTRAYVHLARLDCSQSVWPWLRQVATRLVFDHSRRTKRISQSSVPVLSVEDSTQLVAEREVLVGAVKSLSARQRMAVTLRYLEDWKPAEVALALGLSRPAVEQLLLRARHSLRAEYARLDGESFRLWIWPVFAAFGRIRERATRLRLAIAEVASAPMTLALDATTHAIVAAVIGGSLASGIAAASPGPVLADEQSVTAAQGRVDEARPSLAARRPTGVKPVIRAGVRTPATPLRRAKDTRASDDLPRPHETLGDAPDSPPAADQPDRVKVSTPRRVGGSGGPSPSASASAGRDGDHLTTDERVVVETAPAVPYSDGGTAIDCTRGVTASAACAAHDTASSLLPPVP